MEEWKDIKGYEGYYQVSNQGRVRSLDREVPHAKGKMLRRGKTLSPTRGPEGYLRLGLSVAGVKKSKAVHRLVLEAFVGECPEGMETLHGDGNPANNRLDNLRWGTPKENSQDTIRHGNNYWMNRTHCKNGHELKEGTLRLDNNGKTRTCRMCERRRDREGYVRAKAKGAHPNTLNGLKTHCPQGHEYTPENTSQGSKDRKHRKCKTCNRNRERERRSRLKAEKVAREG